MTSIAYSCANIQTCSHTAPSAPSWLGEVTLIVHHLRQQGVLDAVTQQVRFARRRFGRYEVIDFVAVLLGYAVSSERTLEAFYERLQPRASAFMALFGRDQLPARSTLSRFLAALTSEPVEALRTLFLQDVLARPLVKEERQPGGLWDRQGNHWLVFDVDGTREAARQRALPQNRIDLCPSVGCGSCVLPATQDASVGKSSVPGPRCCKRIRISGSAPLATPVTVSTARNCAEGWQPSKGI